MRVIEEKRLLPSSLAGLAALLLAVDPHGLGGVRLQGRPGPTRDRWFEQFRRLLPKGSPYAKVPVNVTRDRLLGGIDFAATMSAGQPVFRAGLLEKADGGILVLSMAERQSAATAAILCGILDRGVLSIEREGIARTADCASGVVALDEGIDGEEIDPGLADRLAFTLALDETPAAAVCTVPWTAASVDAARQRLAETAVLPDAVELLTRSAAAFAIDSVRAVLFAVRAARAAAALTTSEVATDEHVALAAELVFPQRVRAIPANELEQPEAQEPDDDPIDQAAPTGRDMPDEVLVEAVRACIPDGLRAALDAGPPTRRRQIAGGRHGPKQRSNRRGRPVGAHKGKPGEGRAINVLATLKAAAPWQTLRKREGIARPIEIRMDDIHVSRFEDSVETTTIFAVDASGSQAAQRLAEVKGAIELLLQDCYVQRDQVALIAFRGKSAESLLPPTRALARVKRTLRALPGGGGTPLAAGLDAARQLAAAERHHGRRATIVVLTDGRANIARSGEADAVEAEREALQSGRLIAADGIRALLVDASRRPRPRAKRLAEAMRADYVPLPQADARHISTVVQGVMK